jgi:hypothetical protein
MVISVLTKKLSVLRYFSCRTGGATNKHIAEMRSSVLRP